MAHGVCVNNLPKVVTRQLNGWESNARRPEHYITRPDGDRTKGNQKYQNVILRVAARGGGHVQNKATVVGTARRSWFWCRH